MRRFLNYIIKFFYYGYHGAKHCYDFDAHGVYALEYAHLKRVAKFLSDPDKTYALYNGDPDSKHLRKLRELVELSKFMAEGGDFIDNTSKVLEKYTWSDYMIPNENKTLYRFKPPESYKKEMEIARKLDGGVTECRRERYHKLRKHLGKWWD